MKIYDYSPGNGTRYLVFAAKIDEPGQADILCISPGGWLVGIVNFHNSKCYVFQPYGTLHISWIGEKLKLDPADAEPVTQLLGQIMQRPIKNPWQQCKTCGVPIHPDQNEKGLCVACEYRAKRG